MSHLQQTKVFLRGYRARMHKKPRRACPYRKRDQPAWFTCWQKGWDTAHQVQRDERNRRQAELAEGRR